MPRKLVLLLAAALLISAPLVRCQDVDADDIAMLKKSLPNCNFTVLASKNWEVEFGKCFVAHRQTPGCPDTCKSLVTELGKACLEDAIKAGIVDQSDDLDGDDLDDQEELAALKSIVESCATA